MRGRILLAVFLGVAALVACTKKDSLYIDPGKSDAPSPDRGEPASAATNSDTRARGAP